MNDKEFADNIHMEIHAVRRITNYKPNPMERNISKFVIEKFKDTCTECKNVFEQQQKQPKEKGSFFSKLGKLADA